MEKKVKNKTQVLAHSRRQRENDTFTDIAKALPLQENAKDLDKASILRLAIHYLKLRDLIKDGNEMDKDLLGEELDDAEGEVVSPTSPLSTASSTLWDSDTPIADFLPNFSKDVVQALDGFLMVVSQDGRVLFSSESIANYLGLRQVDVIGVNVQDIIHPQDCSEIARIFQTQGQDAEQVFDPKEPLRRKFVVRMRCAFTPSVRSITRCSNFKPIYCSCFLKFGKSGRNKGQFLGMVSFCKLATISKIKEMVVGTFFKTKHSLDLSYTNVDTRIRWILGYDPSEMTGLKAYQYFHPEDLGVTSSCHMNLLSRGTSHSPCYRFMTRWGDWVWCRSKSQMVFNKRSHLPEGIVIYTWIVRVEEEDERMLAIQNGEDGEDKKKKYDNEFSSSITSDKGCINVQALADPFGTKAKPKREPSLPSPPASTVSEPGHPYTPPHSAESSPLVIQTPQSTTNQMIGSSISSPPMGMAASSPLMGVAMPSPPTGMILSSPPMGMAVSSPPMGVAVSSPPTSLGYATPPHPGYATPPHPGYNTPPHSAMTDYSPNMDPFTKKNTIVSSDVADQSFLFDQAPPICQSFMNSPPYTPYASHAPSLNGSPPYNTNFSSPYSKGQPSPLTSNQGHVYESSDSPSAAATPIYDHMVMTSNNNQVPVSFPEPIFTNQETIRASNGTFTKSFIMTQGKSHVTQFGSQSSTPSPSMELQTTFIPNGNSTSNFTDLSDIINIPLNVDMTTFNEFAHLPPTTTHSLTQAPPHVRQSVINNTRARYSGAIPTGGNLGGVEQQGHVIRHFHGTGTSSEVDESNRISQWSQWLKGSAPAPVC